MRAPFAPPGRSEPRKVEAEAQAMETSADTESPDARILPSSAAMSSPSINGWSTAGTGSCQTSSSAGTSGPRWRERGPMSRWVILNQARAKASANASGSAWKRREMGS